MNSRLLTWMLREIRSLRHRAWVIIGALALGVAAMTAVHALADSVRHGIHLEARPMIAADVVVRSMHPFPDELLAIEAQDRSQTKEMLSMVGTQDGRSLLAELKAVAGSYPLYGALKTDPNQPLEDLLTSEQVLVQPSLLRKLELKVGGEIRINGQTFKIAGQVLDEPDRMNIAMSAGPRILLSMEALERSKLEQFGSRVTRKVQFKSDENKLAELEQKLNVIQDNYSELRIQGASKGIPSASRGVGNVERFLSLVALLSMMVGVIGIVQSIQAWLRERCTVIATYRCLGVSHSELLLLFGGAVLCLAVLGSLIGIALSYLGLMSLFSLLSPYLPIEVSPQVSLNIGFQGLGLGLLSAGLAALYPLRKNLYVSPLAALRSDVEPKPLSLMERIFWGGLTLLLIGLLAVWQANDLTIGLVFLAVAGGIGLVLLGAGYAVANLLGHIKTKWWVLRHAFASFKRPGMAITGAMVALGLGVMVTLTISLLQLRLQDQLGSVHPERAPTAFFIDIQTDHLSY